MRECRGRDAAVVAAIQRRRTGLCTRTGVLVIARTVRAYLLLSVLLGTANAAPAGVAREQGVDPVETRLRSEIAGEPARADLYEQLIALLWSRGRHLDALRECERLMQLTPDRLSVYLQAGRLWLAAGRPDNAYGAFDYYLSRDPLGQAGYLGRAEALVGLGDRAGATADLRQILDLAPRPGEPDLRPLAERRLQGEEINVCRQRRGRREWGVWQAATALAASTAGSVGGGVALAAGTTVATYDRVESDRALPLTLVAGAVGMSLGSSLMAAAHGELAGFDGSLGRAALGSALGTILGAVSIAVWNEAALVVMVAGSGLGASIGYGMSATGPECTCPAQELAPASGGAGVGVGLPLLRLEF